jgi:hypothetical protein
VAVVVESGEPRSVAALPEACDFLDVFAAFPARGSSGIMATWFERRRLARETRRVGDYAAYANRLATLRVELERLAVAGTLTQTETVRLLWEREHFRLATARLTEEDKALRAEYASRIAKAEYDLQLYARLAREEAELDQPAAPTSTRPGTSAMDNGDSRPIGFATSAKPAGGDEND